MQYEKEVVLKDGKSCIIRHGRPEDAAEVCELFAKTHGETDFLTSYPDENTFTTEQEADFLQKRAESENEVELCAIVGGKIVATAGVDSLGRKDKIKHRAEFGISVEKAYQGLGIGRTLAQACIEAAMVAGYLQMELEVVEGNLPAISLYKSLGFRQYGRNEMAFRTREGIFQSVLLMKKEL